MACSSEYQADITDMELEEKSDRFYKDLEKDNAEGNASEKLLVWPWMGIVANIPVQWSNGKYVGQSGSKLRDFLRQKGFNPVRVNPLWNYRGHSGYAVVEFNRDWPGFSNAMMFENFYGENNRGRRDYYEAANRGDELYGWVAHDDDYNLGGIIGEHLRKIGDLKTVSDVEAEDARKTSKLLSNLSNTIVVKNMRLKELEGKYSQTSISLNNLMKEKDEMHKTYNEGLKLLRRLEIQKIQQNARGYLESILKEHESTALHLKAQSKELEEREKELEKRQALNENEIWKLSAEKEMNERARLEQKKADEKVLKLAEEQRREKERAHRKIIELEKQLDAKQALELEIERMKGALPVMEHMGDNGDAEVLKRLVAIRQKLEEKQEELSHLEELNRALLIKELTSNDELQQARKELIDGLMDQKSRALIGIKRMGEIDTKLIHLGTKRKYPGKEGENISMELCSLLEDRLRDPTWHPFKVVQIEGTEDHKPHGPVVV
ncbi:hypothetical protein LguiB_000796 [Lonicera macranthoides]